MTERARAAFERIVEAQGRRASPAVPGAFVRAVEATRSGVVTSIDDWMLAGVARRAGAPNDRGAGLDLLAHLGDRVRADDALYLIHASSEADLASASVLAGQNCGYLLSD